MEFENRKVLAITILSLSSLTPYDGGVSKTPTRIVGLVGGNRSHLDFKLWGPPLAKWQTCETTN